MGRFTCVRACGNWAEREKGGDGEGIYIQLTSLIFFFGRALRVKGIWYDNGMETLLNTDCCFVFRFVCG
jgi:hypothetical protein